MPTLQQGGLKGTAPLIYRVQLDERGVAGPFGDLGLIISVKVGLLKTEKRRMNLSSDFTSAAAAGCAAETEPEPEPERMVLVGSAVYLLPFRL